ncbi:MAG: hypothetical protein M1812_000798 [Candelaria pacifica]|nr:MAG: hypothetical protein M1812_000798 [Candelaria pacifica]
MQFFQILLLVTVLLSVALAAPARQQLKGRSFKVERVRRSNYIRSGPAALSKAYRKYGIESPHVLASSSTSTNSTNGDPSSSSAGISNGKASNSGSNGDVNATPEQGDAEFLSPVTIGNQTLMMDFDTGSSDTWVFNTQLSKSLIQGHTAFNPFQSPTFRIIPGATFKVSYGDSSKASGNVGLDSVSIGGVSFPNQAVELATSVTDQFITDINNDGLVGLAFSKLNTVRPQAQQTFFDNVLPTLAQPVFTANLKHGADSGSGYEFGNIDTSKFKGDLAYIPINSTSGFWQFESSRFSVNGKSLNAVGGPTIADTGTSLILLNDAVVAAYYAQVPNASMNKQAGGYTFPCNTKLPDLGIGIGDTYTATISGNLINFGNVGGGACFGGVQGNSAGDLQILGDVMFKSQFVVFDAGQGRVGFAPHV